MKLYNSFERDSTPGEMLPYLHSNREGSNQPLIKGGTVHTGFKGLKDNIYLQPRDQLFKALLA